ncbi:MAG: hypothetical protein U5K30_05045 [Acidimicrobiales bacterium]|nr:hypothetical protein [Acidimicrobiales bacterium]
MSTHTGTARLIRFILRRDRVRLAVWVVGLAGVVIASASSLPPLYPDQQSIDQYALLFGDNPALVAFAGPGYGFDDPNLGVILVNETQLWACIAAALMSIFLVNRHTRAEEDDERADLLRSNVVGRHAPVTAAVVVVVGANAVLAAVCAVAFVALGYATVGSVALAGSIGLTGLAFTAITVVAAQIASGGRAALGLASAFLGAAFVIRAVGDIAGSWVRWLSPIGWAQGLRAFAGEQWWPLGLCLVFVAGMFWLARVLFDRRDLGSGILTQRAGRPRARRWLTSPIGLAVRLQRGTILGWTAATFIVGLVYGSIGESIEEMVADNPTFADVLAQQGGADITASFFATCMSQIALLAAGFAISAALRPRSEEVAGRAEQVLAMPLSRTAWVGSHLLVAAVGTVVVIGAGGLGVGISYATVSSDVNQITRMLGAAMATLPAVLVLGGLAVALFGASLRLSLIAWAGLAVTVLVQFFGELLQLPGWAMSLSPLQHVPGLPAEDLEVVPLLALSLVAVTLAAVGVGSLRARDVAA